MGTHVTTGTTDPTAAQGIIGDIYLNTTSHTLFGPKTAGGWGTGINLNSAGLVAAATYGNWAYPTFNTWLSLPEMTLTLPPGKWFIQGKGDNQFPQTAFVTERLQNTTANQTLDAVTTNVGSNQTGMIGWSVGAMVNVTATTTIQLQVNATGAGSVDSPKLFAMPLSSINGA
jgi:hypothetical protein